MKHNKKNDLQSKPPRRHPNLSTPMIKSFALNGDSRQMTSDTVAMRPAMHAARAVFNTPELLEAILAHLSTKSLAQAFTVSRYCRQVTLGSLELRRTLFLDPSPATKFVELKDGRVLEPEATSSHNMPKPSHDSRVIIKAHPALIPPTKSALDSYLAMRRIHLFDPTYDVSHLTIQTMPPSTLLFQPSPPSIKVFCCGQFVLKLEECLTFGALAKELRRLRDQYQKRIDNLVKLPCTPLNRKRYAHAMGMLDGLSRRDDSVSHEDWCISLAAEGAVYDDSEYIGMKWKGREEIICRDW